MYCPKCGKENEQTAVYCESCGAKLHDAPAKERTTQICPQCGCENKGGALPWEEDGGCTDRSAVQSACDERNVDSQQIQSKEKAKKTYARRIAKILLLVAMVCFIFPFVTVSCGSEDYTFSGVEAATTIVINEEKSSLDLEKFYPNVFLIGAFLLAAVGLYSVWSKNRYQNTNRLLVTGCAAGGAVYLGLFRATFFDYYDFGYSADLFRVEYRFGWIISLIAFCGAALIVLLSKPEQDEDAYLCDQSSSTFTLKNGEASMEKPVDANLIERTLGAWLSKFGQSGMFNSEAHGYIGLIGTLMVLGSPWMPFIKEQLVSISYFDLLSEKESVFPFVIVIVLAAALCLYATRLHILGFVIAVMYTIASLLFLVQAFDGMPIRAVFSMAGSGLYVMGIGLILMLVSPFLWRVHEKIETLFYPQSIKENG